ncbi:MAG: cyanophycinase [Pseudomonas sp.]|nr:cyanophycinase [Pseudomonas sp.]MDZ4191822.1 cyanophycinase [Pseudomonas sp.]
MNKQRNLRGLLAALLLCGSADPVMADGNLLAVGGMLRASNSLVYEKLIELAGGAQQARIAIMPTASGSLGSSKRFQAELEALGVPAEHIRIVGIDRHNYQDTMNDPAVVAPLREASAVWFVGGDQARIARALFNADGSPSLAMQAVQAIYDKGGVVAGTSAGASILGARMPTAYGVVMDTLDFGVATAEGRRGTALLRGAGLFTAGVIDQHFDKIEETSSGRAARMASYLLEQPAPGKGFGLDTNTAMWIKPSGELEVLGEGYLTIMDPAAAKKSFGLYGTRIDDMRLAMLGHGDRYDLASGEIRPDAGKQPIEPGNEYLVGNRLLTDLSAVSAINRAVLYGLADNTASRQLGLMTRYNPANGYHYGYRFEFSTRADVAAHSRFHDSQTNYSVSGVRLDIRPVTADLREPAAGVPRDAGNGRRGDAIRAVTFRGLMTLNAEGAFEAQRPITRGELANALQMTLAAEPNLKALPTLSDVPAEHPLREHIEVVVSNGWMDGAERFDAERPASRADWALACKALVERFSGATLSKSVALPDVAGLAAANAEAAAQTVAEGWLSANQGRFEPAAPVARAEVAETLSRIIGL